MNVEDHHLHALLKAVIGHQDATVLMQRVHICDALIKPNQQPRVSRAVFAMALNLLLFDALLKRVPTGRAYAAECLTQKSQIFFDHGALRTIDGPTGELPAGYHAFRRILEPLGYAVAGVYPLDDLKMTGRAFAHRDLPEDIPQFFVSELHVSHFSATVQRAAKRVFGKSINPITGLETAALHELSITGALPFEPAALALPGLVAAFDRHHHIPALADYEILLDASAEAAWIATEGNAFNHATDRVVDVEAIALQQRLLGRPIKDIVEVSASGRVRQTAFHADPVKRSFRLKDGTTVTRQVPGSFYEFISRARNPDTGALDLSFDSKNAQGIFAMTQAA